MPPRKTDATKAKTRSKAAAKKPRSKVAASSEGINAPKKEKPALPPGEPRKVIDWEGVEREFRAGSTARSIGAMFGISHTAVLKRASAEGWEQADIMDEVRRATKAKLVSKEVSKEVSNQTRIEQVDEAAEIRAALIRQHQARFAKLQALCDTLADRLAIVLDGQETDGKLCLGDRESPADLLRKLTVTTATLTEKERQALGIDEGGGSGDIKIHLIHGDADA